MSSCPSSALSVFHLKVVRRSASFRVWGRELDLYIHETAQIEDGASVAATCRVWQYAHIREGARIGEHTSVGRAVYVGPSVQIGSRCKIQNYALIYEPSLIEDGVFIGPGAILTNDRFPRAVNPDDTIKSSSDWIPVGVHLKNGCSLGAGSICVAPVVVGRWAMVAAGSTVTSEVPDFSLVAGSPARWIAWIDRTGNRLEHVSGDFWRSRTTDMTYRETNGRLTEFLNTQQI